MQISKVYDIIGTDNPCLISKIQKLIVDGEENIFLPKGVDLKVRDLEKEKLKYEDENGNVLYGYGIKDIRDLRIMIQAFIVFIMLVIIWIMWQVKKYGIVTYWLNKCVC